MNGVDYEKRTESVNNISNKLNEIIGDESTLGKSLNEENLRGIITKVLVSS